MADYGEYMKTHQSEFFGTNWLVQPFAPFNAAVLSSCVHNLPDFKLISEIYGDMREHLKAGGVFLSMNLERFSSYHQASQQ
jgi:hypothetical protein